MKKITVLLLVVALLLCACGQAAPEQTTGAPTDPPERVVWQPQIMYNGNLYYYPATGFDEPLPSGYEEVGEIKSVSIYQFPTEDLTGGLVDVGQKVYANGAVPKTIYVKYDTGYAAFSLRD